MGGGCCALHITQLRDVTYEYVQFFDVGAVAEPMQHSDVPLEVARHDAARHVLHERVAQMTTDHGQCFWKWKWKFWKWKWPKNSSREVEVFGSGSGEK